MLLKIQIGNSCQETSFAVLSQESLVTQAAMASRREVARTVGRIGLNVFESTVMIAVTLAGHPECAGVVTPFFSLAANTSRCLSY